MWSVVNIKVFTLYCKDLEDFVIYKFFGLSKALGDFLQTYPRFCNYIHVRS